MANLKPDYLAMDYETIVAEIKDILQSSETFKDYNYEGSNIAFLIELIAYLGDLNKYYMNTIAKNVFIDTANLYENVHRMAQLIGYKPKGYIASRTDLQIEITQSTEGQYFSEDDQLFVPKWTNFFGQMEINGVRQKINFVSTSDVLITIDRKFVENSTDEITYYRFSIPIKQGVQVTYNYFGSDIFDNKIILPFDSFDYDDSLQDDSGSVDLLVNGELWSRVRDFYSEMSGLEDDSKVYTLEYDKYQRYIISFSNFHSVPKSTDNIEIRLIRTLGKEGNVGANIIKSYNEAFIENIVTEQIIPTNNTSIINPRATAGGTSPEDISSIKNNTKNFSNAQFRCVTKRDYKTFLEAKDDVVKATAWGEHELAYHGDTREYNKVHITLIPSSWNLYSIAVRDITWEVKSGKSVTIMEPYQYLPRFKDNILSYLEPYKLNSFEVFELPDLVYFAFDISLKINKPYQYPQVVKDVKEKLNYYFQEKNRDFNDVIDFGELTKFITDSSIVSDTNNFSNIKGISEITFRSVYSNKEIYEPNRQNNYPQYKINAFTSGTENQLRPIILGHDQFPMLSISGSSFSNEG